MDFGAKDVDEIKLLRFGFENELEAGETIATFTVDVEVDQGVDASASAVKSGPAAQSGVEVIQRVTGGIDGVVYKFRARAVGNSGLAHVVAGRMRVVRL